MIEGRTAALNSGKLETEIVNSLLQETDEFQDSRPKFKQRSFKAGGWGVRIAVTLGLLSLWEIVTSYGHVPSVALPPPEQVAHKFWFILTVGYQGHTLLQHTFMSLIRIGTGFLSAALLGVLLGVSMSASKITFHVFDPIVQFLRPIPPLIYIPLLQVWFGIGELPKDVLIFICAFPYVTIGTIAGARGAKETMVRMAQCFGANKIQVYRYVILPSALPEILTSLRMALGMAWTCLVASEMIAASSGLGWIAIMAGQQLQTETIFVSVVCIAILGYAMDLILRKIEKRLIPWKGKT